jgi:hypothetical protein
VDDLEVHCETPPLCVHVRVYTHCKIVTEFVHVYNVLSGHVQRSLYTNMTLVAL